VFLIESAIIGSVSCPSSLDHSSLGHTRMLAHHSLVAMPVEGKVLLTSIGGHRSPQRGLSLDICWIIPKLLHNLLLTSASFITVATIRAWKIAPHPRSFARIKVKLPSPPQLLLSLHRMAKLAPHHWLMIN